MAARINAIAIWRDNDVTECRILYREFVRVFRGDFYAVCRAYGWKRAPMLKALRIGRAAHANARR